MAINYEATMQRIRDDEYKRKHGRINYEATMKQIRADEEARVKASAARKPEPAVSVGSVPVLGKSPVYSPLARFRTGVSDTDRTNAGRVFGRYEELRSRLLSDSYDKSLDRFSLSDAQRQNVFTALDRLGKDFGEGTEWDDNYQGIADDYISGFNRMLDDSTVKFEDSYTARNLEKANEERRNALYTEWMNLNRQELETGVYGDRTASDVWDEYQRLDDEHKRNMAAEGEKWLGNRFQSLDEQDRKLVDDVVDFYYYQGERHGISDRAENRRARDSYNQAISSLYEKYGAEQANALIQTRTRERNADRAEWKTERFEEAADKYGFLTSVGAALTNIPGSIAAAADIAGQAIYNPAGYRTLDVNTQGMDLQNYTRTTIDRVSQNVEARGGKVASWAYQLGMSILDSAAAMVSGTGGFLALSAATNTMQDITERGGDMEQAIAGGLVSGIAEAVFERYSIEQFEKLTQKDVVRTARDWLENIGKSMVTNASEEMFTEAANIISDSIIMSDLSQYAETVRRLMAENPGMSESEAKARAAGQLGLQILESGLSGAVMGAVFGSVGSAVSAGRTAAQDRAEQAVEPTIEPKKPAPTVERKTNMSKDGNMLLDAAYNAYREANPDSAVSENEYSMEFEIAYEYGKSGADIETTRKSDAIRNLSAATIEAAHSAGRQAARAALGEDTNVPATQATDTASQEAAPDIETVKIRNVPKTVRDQIVRDYTEAGDEVSAADYAGAAAMAYNYGEAGLRIDDVTAENEGASAELIRKYYDMGVSARNAELERAKIKNAAFRAANPKGVTGQVRSITAEESDKYGVGTITRKTFNKRQKAAIQVANSLAKDLGINVVLFESKVGKGGVREGDNGFYANRTLYIDIEAGYNNEQAMLRTLSHEMTHYLEDAAPEQYESLRQFVTDYFYESGELSDLIVREQQLASRNGETLTENEAMLEVVANACETMLRDTEAMRAMLRHNTSLFRTIRGWIDDFAKAVRRAWQGISAYEEAAKSLERSEKALREVSKLWYEALAESAVGSSAVETKEAVDTFDSEIVRRSRREIDPENVTPATQEESLSMDATDARNLARYQNELQQAIKGELPPDIMVLLGKPSDVLRKYMKSENTIYIPQTVVKKVTNTKEKGGKHGLGIAVLEELPFQFEDPMAITGNTSQHVAFNDRSIVVWTDWKTVAGDSIIVPIRIDSSGNVGTYNNINSVFDAYDTDYVADLLREGNVIYTRNNKTIQDLLAQRRDMPKRKIPDGSKETITQDDPNVKPRRSRRDSNGNEISEAQAEYFADSVVRDDDGNLMVVYHGTPHGGHTTFRSGTYFTADPQYAGLYQDPGASMLRVKNRDNLNPMTYAGYLNIKKPFDTRIPEIRELWENEFYMSYSGTPLSDSGLPDWTDGIDLQEFIEENEYDFDGLILDEGSVGGYGDDIKSRGLSYVIFNSNQFKNADNKNPTDDPDIRRSRRDPYAVSDREVLANAYEYVAVNAAEDDALKRYRKNIDKLEDLEQQLEAINDRLRQQFVAGGERLSKAEVSKLSENKKTIQNQIARQDRVLLNFERSAALKRVLEVAKKTATDKVKAKAREDAKAYRERIRAEREAGAENLREYKAKTRESRKKAEYKERVMDLTRELTSWIVRPDNKKHVPTMLVEPIGKFLESIDLSSKALLAGKSVTQRDSRFRQALSSLREAVSGEGEHKDELFALDISPVFSDYLRALQGAAEQIAERESGVFVVEQMTGGQLETLYKVLKELRRVVTTANQTLTLSQYDTVDRLARDTLAELESMKKKPDQPTPVRAVDEFFQWDNTTPVYAFDRFGAPGQAIFQSLQNAQSQLASDSDEVIRFAEEAYTAKEVREWQRETHEIQRSGETVTVTTAQLMELYNLMRRDQGRSHIEGGTIRFADYKGRRGVNVTDQGGAMSMDEVEAALSLLTEQQIKVAEAMQDYATENGGAWGNEISMRRFGIRSFTEERYWPVRTDKNTLSTAIDADGNDLYRLLNKSFTKPTTQGANNMIIVGNVFDTFASHMSDMAQYHSFALPVLDMLRWINYKESTTNADGQRVERTVKGAMDTAFGKAAQEYVRNLLRDINGNQTANNQSTKFAKQMLGRYNRAAVGANLRVAMLQPTAIARAQLVESGLRMARGMTAFHYRRGRDEMLKWSGIAKWKDLGFFEVNVSRNLTSLIKREKTAVDKIVDSSMKLAEIGDRMTWVAIWNGCRSGVLSEGRYEEGSDEFFREVARRFENVVYRTQVVDSILTKSDFMRRDDFFSRSSASFMSEPTLTYNTLLSVRNRLADDARKYGKGESWKRNRKYAARALITYAISQAISSAVQALSSVMRDDEEYQTFGEKYREQFLDALKDNFNLMGNLPILSQLQDVINSILAAFGYDTFGFDPYSGIFEWSKDVIRAAELIRGREEGTSKYTDYGIAYKLLSGVSSFIGLPISGATREVVSAYNLAVQIYNEYFGVLNGKKLEPIRQYDAGAENRVKYAYRDGYLTKEEAVMALQEDAELSEKDAKKEVLSWVTSEAKAAYLDGAASEEETVDALAESGLTSESDAQDTVDEWDRAAIKEDFDAGLLSEEEAAERLVSDGGYEENDAYWKVKEWAGGEDYGKYNEFYAAVEKGTNLKSVVKTYLDNGVKKETLASQITEHFKPIFVELYKANKASSLMGYLLNAYELLGYKREDKKKDILAWPEQARKKEEEEKKKK